MKTIFSVIKTLKANGKKIENLKEKQYDINLESHLIIDRMSDEEVEITLRKVTPDFICYETSGPHDDYYVVNAGYYSDSQLGTGDTKKEALRAALKRYVWEEGVYNKYEADS